MSLELNRQLPLVRVGEDMFYADATSYELIELDNPNNRIPVILMMNFDDHHEFEYDKVTKNAYEGNLSLAPPGRVETVWIRRIEALDPVGMEILIQQGRYHWTEHYESPLPIVEIGGINFYVDDIRNGFREVENRWNIIQFSDVVKRGIHGVFFDTMARNVPFPFELNSYDPPEVLPDHINFAAVPTGFELAKLLSTVKRVGTDTAHARSKKKHNFTGRKGGSPT